MTLESFSNFRRNGGTPNQHTYPLLLKTLSNQNPNQIHAQALKFGLCNDTFVQNALVSAYANGGFLDFARVVFNENPRRDSVLWTAMINGFVKNNEGEKGLDCFMRMRSLGVFVDGVTVVGVLGAIGVIGDVWFGRWIHGFYVVCGRVQFDVYVGGALLNMYVKCGCCDDLRKLFDEMPVRNVVLWTVLISGYVNCSRFKEALLVFQDMLVDKQIEPNQATLSSVLTACAHLGALDQGRWVHSYIDKNKVVVNSILGTSLVDMYAKCGCIEEAFWVFETLPRKNVYAWTTMINGLAMHGEAQRSLDLLYRMLIDGIPPNEVTFVGILCACCHGGLLDEGRRCFSSMNQIYGVEPNVNHYGCMVDLLGRAGKLGEAFELIKNMPMEPTAGVWGALFSACIIHKDYELGEQIGKHLINLRPNHSGRYMRLANLYAICGKWDDVARIRKFMKEKGVKKIRGYSAIEVDGVTHEFIAGVNPKF
ncbi:hypothetical protein GIB67_020805 [Kingdonia uniflora]|uniref:Pentatricopeptide repeat-containing protein n=1 Tax=Kingdonia uniflora TaxID=39325 RepID=A0A7J7M799_9MAGN|nr:hypothetical protein GIB67_020805 [Kingdonia uniflora]